MAGTRSEHSSSRVSTVLSVTLPALLGSVVWVIDLREAATMLGCLSYLFNVSPSFSRNGGQEDFEMRGERMRWRERGRDGGEELQA